MFVSKEFRTLGLGQNLLNVELEFAEKSGYSKISLYSLKELQAARILYPKNDFVDIARYNGDQRTDIFMARIL